MDFELSEEQRLLVDSARKLTVEHLEPILARHSASMPLPKAAMLEVYGHFANFGITAARLPAEYGGSGLSMLDYGLILEQLPPVLALSLISHDGSITRLHAGASERVRQKYLPALIGGTKIACTANSESGAGSDSNAVRTRVSIESDAAFISGSKSWITNASVADVIIVSCAEEPSAGGRPPVRRVLVDVSESAVAVRETALTGLRQGHLSELTFERTPVPVDHLIGTSGDAGKYMTLAWNGNRPMLGLLAVHIAEQALKRARDYAAQRTQFGRPLAAQQLIQPDLADIESSIISSRLMCLYALDCLDRGIRANGSSAMAKRFATGQALRAVDLAMQIHGAMGITEELGLEQLWRDLRVLQVPDGTMGILALIQGREITGTSAFR